MDNLFTETVETARRYARTVDPQTSKDAALKMVESGELSRQEKWVYGRIKKYRNDDFTTKDLAALAWEVGVDYFRANDICKRRFSGLECKDKIEPIPKTVLLGGKERLVINVKTGKIVYKRRDGCRVWRLK